MLCEFFVFFCMVLNFIILYLFLFCLIFGLIMFVSDLFIYVFWVLCFILLVMRFFINGRLYIVFESLLVGRELLWVLKVIGNLVMKLWSDRVGWLGKVLKVGSCCYLRNVFWVGFCRKVGVKFKCRWLWVVVVVEMERFEIWKDDWCSGVYVGVGVVVYLFVLMFVVVVYCWDDYWRCVIWKFCVVCKVDFKWIFFCSIFCMYSGGWMYWDGWMNKEFFNLLFGWYVFIEEEKFCLV